jgi:glycosyltransferase involved in cell wall biosynthesis
MLNHSIPAVDVLIPAYNAERTLASSIQSIQDQSVRDIRIIVVNDGSTDRTGELLRAIAADDARVFVINTPNRGIVEALNLALEHSDAPIIARHDADDMAFPDRFTRQLAYLNANPDCLAVGAEVFQISDDGRRIGRTHFTREGPPNPTALPAVEPYLLHPFLMVRGEALRAAGGYRHVLHAEDADLYWRLLSRGRLHNMPDLLGEYRIHAGSITSASVHRGRVGSAYAELAALSFRRRETGRADIDFPADALTRVENLRSMDEVLDYLSRQLTVEEREHFRLAAAIKLLLNASYRPYQLEVDDARFIAAAKPALIRRLDHRGRAKLLRWYAGVLLKMLRARRFAELRALEAPVAAYAQLAPMLARRVLNRLRA